MADKRLAVLYDGGCGMCRREIAYYRRLDAAARIDWVDISDDDRGALAAVGISWHDAMARLHVVMPGGRTVTGAHAFAVLWSQLPYWRWLSRGITAAGLLPLLDFAYGHFARRRLRRRLAGASCALGSAKKARS